MENFIEALKLNLVIHKITKNVDFDNDKITKENLKRLTSVIFNIDVPIFYLDLVSQIQNIYITDIIDTETVEPIDYSELNKYEQLQSLIITHNKNIQKLDISNLKNLKVLIIVGNENLIEINGIENLENLEKVIIVGNNIRSFNNMKKFLENLTSTTMCKLDVNMYHELVNDKNFNIRDYNVSFGEKISVGEFYSLSIDEMAELYNKGLQIIRENITSEMIDYEKAKKIYEYIVENLTYAHDELKVRDENAYSDSISIYNNDYKDINISYKALKDGVVVCEGYANLLKFLLNIVGIESKTIACFHKETGQPFEYFNHTASMIKIDDNWYYCDSQLEKDSKNLKYFLIPREDFQVTHRLPSRKSRIK